MRLSLFRCWREKRLIHNALRNSPSPKAPEWLKARLIERAVVAQADASDARAPGILRLTWGLPVVAVALAVGWSILRSPVDEAKPKPRTSVVQVPVRDVVRTSPEQAPEVAKRPKEPATEHAVVRTARRPRQRHAPVRTYVARDEQPREPVIQVSVTRSPEPEVGYARVAAYSSDDSGRLVKTAWTSVDDPQAGTSRQEMYVDDGSGRLQSLTVAVEMPLERPKGEEL